MLSKLGPAVLQDTSLEARVRQAACVREFLELKNKGRSQTTLQASPVQSCDWSFEPLYTASNTYPLPDEVSLAAVAEERVMPLEAPAANKLVRSGPDRSPKNLATDWTLCFHRTSQQARTAALFKARLAGEAFVRQASTQWPFQAPGSHTKKATVLKGKHLNQMASLSISPDWGLALAGPS